MQSNPQKKRRYPFKRNVKRKIRRIIFMLVAAALATGINYYNNNYSADNNSTIETSSAQFSASKQQQAIKKIRAAKNDTNAQFWIGFNGKIIKKLKDDLSGSRHQKFLVSPAKGLTLLVAHNIDLASRVPIDIGDTISLYGRYEWNNRGGVMHWTHQDPKGKKKGGWIRANGKIYR